MSVPLFQLPYQPFVDLKLRFEGHDRVEDYRRELDLDQAIASVRYKLDGVTYRREVFCSFPDQALVVRLEADRPENADVPGGALQPSQGEPCRGAR